MNIPLAVNAQTQTLNTALPEDSIERGVAGEPQQIVADVGTEEPLARIDLFYRFEGESAYTRTPMQQGNPLSRYAATVPTDVGSAGQLEFHIVAEETTGSELRKGSPDMPLIRLLIAPPGSSAEQQTNVSDAKPDRRRFWYIALGALAVGALAAANSGGGGSGTSDEGCAPAGCQLVVTLPPPQ